jgi:hypothetical protein
VRASRRDVAGQPLREDLLLQVRLEEVEGEAVGEGRTAGRKVDPEGPRDRYPFGGDSILVGLEWSLLRTGVRASMPVVQ